MKALLIGVQIMNKTAQRNQILKSRVGMVLKKAVEDGLYDIHYRELKALVNEHIFQPAYPVRRYYSGEITMSCRYAMTDRGIYLRLTGCEWMDKILTRRLYVRLRRTMQSEFYHD